jgi:hypothetical protein
MGVIRDLLSQYVSPDIYENLSTYLTYTPSGAISAAFIIFALWAASKAQYSMMRISNYSFTGHPPEEKLVQGTAPCDQDDPDYPVYPGVQPADHGLLRDPDQHLYLLCKQISESGFYL